MKIGLSSLVVFVYTLGVLFTGMWAAELSFPDLTPVRLGALVVLALVWTGYASLTVIPRIVEIETEDEEAAEDEPGPAETT